MQRLGVENSLLSILIPTLDSRISFRQALLEQLATQAIEKPVEILLDNSNSTIGEKRNNLLQAASGKYVAFIDDDDVIADDYISLIVGGLEADTDLYDCCSLDGIITTNGKYPKRFTHSIQYNSYYEKDGILYRPPNHLNTIRASIAKQFKFPEINFGEDTDWAMQICKSGLLKKEYYVDHTLYYYKYITNK